MTKTVLVPIADGSEDVETASIVDVLHRAGGKVTTASVMPHKEVKCANGLRVVADVLISDVQHEVFDCIACPGGMPGAKHLSANAILVKMLKDQKTAGRLYAAICASPKVVLEEHGLLEGKKAVGYPGFALKDTGVGRVCVDGNCVTSQGPGTALEFGLALAAILFGDEKKQSIHSGMLVA